MKAKKVLPKFINFMFTRAGGSCSPGHGHVGHTLQTHYFYGAKCRQTEYMYKHVLLNKEGASIIVISSPGGGIPVLGCGHNAIYQKCMISIEMFFSTLKHALN